MQPDFSSALSLGVVDDDAQLRLLLSHYMRKQGYRVWVAGDVRTAREKLGTERTDLLILDVMLPGSNGFDFCRELRATGGLPIIMLTAQGEEGDRIAGLEVGADDYVTKPFSPRELLARIRAVLRRQSGATITSSAAGAELVSFDGWTLDLRRRELSNPAGSLVELTTGEYDLLLAFIENANRTLSREMLLELAKSRSADTTDRVIDVQVSRLRKKLASSEDNASLIKTVRGIGYMMTPRVLER